MLALSKNKNTPLFSKQIFSNGRYCHLKAVFLKRVLLVPFDTPGITSTVCQPSSNFHTENDIKEKSNTSLVHVEMSFSYQNNIASFEIQQNFLHTETEITSKFLKAALLIYYSCSYGWEITSENSVQNLASLMSLYRRRGEKGCGCWATTVRQADIPWSPQSEVASSHQPNGTVLTVF